MIAEVPLGPSREQARAWAVEELAQREYTSRAPGLFERAWNWLWDRLNSLQFPESSSSAVVFGLVIAVLVALIAFAIYRAGLRLEAKAETQAPVLGAAVRTAAEHRAEAARLAASGDWHAAVIERFRALARQLEEDAVLVPAPGRTAGEVARETGRRRPEFAEAVAGAAAVFDDVRYGDREAGPEQEAAVGAVDDLVRGKTAALR